VAARAGESLVVLIPSDTTDLERGLAVLHVALTNLLAPWPRPGGYVQRPESPFAFDPLNVTSLRIALRSLDRAAEESQASTIPAAADSGTRLILCGPGEAPEVQARLGARSVHAVPVSKDRLHVEDVDSFAKVRDVHPRMIAGFLKDGYLDQAEDAIQRALESVLGVSFHKKDWGGEGNDLYTSNVLVNGARIPTAFMLKGKGQRSRTMEVKHCRKNGGQVIRLFQSPAYLFVIQFVGNISEAVIQHAQSEVAQLKLQGKETHFLILDGQDTARLMHAYGKL
jgi:hypothetical protein